MDQRDDTDKDQDYELGEDKPTAAVAEWCRLLARIIRRGTKPAPLDKNCDHRDPDADQS